MLRSSTFVLLVALATSLPLAAQQTLAAASVAFTGATVIDPDVGLPVENATVVIENGLITSVEAGGPVPAGMRTIDLAGRFLVPGLIDAHVHISNLSDARRALTSGVTTARSMGGSFFADVGLRELFRRGAFDGPEILAAGYHIRPRPSEGLFLDDPSLSDLLGRDIRGPEALRRVVRSMLERDVDFIKVTATARAGLPDTDPRRPLYTEAELSALVAEAAAAGVPVAAHAHGDVGGRAAVAAGVRSIEHGTYLREGTLRMMVERGTVLVPTIAVVSDLTLPGGDYDDPVLQVRGRHMLPRVRETAALAHALGVPIAAGVLFPFIGLLLSPMVAAAAMSLSSVSVIANALRLRTLKLD